MVLKFGPIVGYMLRQQIHSFYASIGGIANGFGGNDLLDNKSVQSDLGHPKYCNKVLITDYRLQFI